MAIRSLGAASGLDLESLVTQLVTVERNTKVARLDSTKKELDSSLSGFGKLKSALTKFKDTLTALGDDKLRARTTSIKQPTDTKTYLEATSSSTAAPGNFDIKVKSLATGSRIESANNAYSSSSAVVSTTAGKLTFEADGKTFDVNVKANMTLDEFRKAVNNASGNFGVSANIINAGSGVGTKLVLTSSVTGDGNELKITGDNAALDSLTTQAFGSTDPVSGGLDVAVEAGDAEVVIDGISVFSKNNTFKNAIQDTELTVSAVTPDGNNATLTIETDKKAAEEKIKAFMDAYNSLLTEVNTLTKNRTLGEDGKTVLSEGGALSSDPMVRSIMSQVTKTLGSAFSSGGAELNNLYALGITFNDQGKMEISSTRLYGADSGRERFDEALENNYDKIADLFGGTGGITKEMDKIISQFTDRDGLLVNKETSLKDQLKKNTKDREAFERYIVSYEETLRQRYGALDSTLGQLQSTSSYLVQQLANLPKFGS
ncbi:flagellar cap protein [Rheinheimera mesophila]|uniref:Flagellar hook-associated protein 2 n=1 Tax=Rheinheimera mesophila TaxID=1547515 RepID=A0A3P3QPP6_9GAMM|nr:flagellar filament capping protein FliD [Rheinheimera mesophila]KKL01566.1 flagellar cap protein [Rheinheimera mesophila]RRJ23217.1 flagellar cap protein [Rheinheimera mesophila]